MSTCCTYMNGGYAHTDIKCAPHMVEFPEGCPMRDVNNSDISEIGRLIYVANEDCKRKNWTKLSLLLKGLNKKFIKAFK